MGLLKLGKVLSADLWGIKMTEKVLFIGCENYMDHALGILKEYKEKYEGRKYHQSVGCRKEGHYVCYVWGGNGKQITIKMIEQK